MIVWQLLLAVLAAAWNTFFLAAPFVLCGLLVAGLLQVLVPQRLLARWMGGGGLAAASRAALLGLPLPICSCGIVPVAIALRRKGASLPAILAFLITTPESSADAVVLTWGLMGPLMAVARLVAALIAALLAAAVAIVAFPPESASSPSGETAAAESDGHAGHGGHHDHDHDHDHDDDALVDARGLWASMAAALRRYLAAAPPRHPGAQPTGAPEPAEPAAAGPAAGPDLRAPAPRPPATVPLSRILRAVGRHAFVELVDDIVFWLVIGVLAAGALAALVPADALAVSGGLGLGGAEGFAGLGGRLLVMLVMLAVATPMYVCASASTPIAAALIAKGVSPGAALVFLLAGPATNAATLTLLGRHFGARFLRIYLGTVLAAALGCGLTLDVLAAGLGWSITGQLATEAEGVAAFFELLCALLLLALVVWRLWAGAARQGWRELAANLRGAGRWLASLAAAGGIRAPTARAIAATLAVLAASLYLLSGVVRVPPDSLGFELRFGRLTADRLGPGLHWMPPRPFARAEVWRVRALRQADVGFRTDLRLLARRQELLRAADPAQWHSPLAAMNTDSREASYLSGDENLLEMSFSVHYGLADPRAFFYRLDRRHDTVGLCSQAAARALVAARTLDELLTTGRGALEVALRAEIQRRLDGLGSGVRVVSVHVVDLHPPQDAVFAFRDVSSAREDRDRRIQAALADGEKEVPRARGNAALATATAQAAADSARLVATGRADAFTARAAVFESRGSRGSRAAGGPRGAAGDILRDLLWLETEERVLPGRRKFVVPPGASGRHVVLWPDRPSAMPTLPSDAGEP